jgi:hypothetical protein
MQHGRGWLRRLSVLAVLGVVVQAIGFRAAPVLGSANESVPAVMLASPSMAPVQLDYFALGDSIPSGHGLGDSGDCRQSERAYPHIVQGLLESQWNYQVNFHLLACSGASLEAPDNTYKWFQNQADAALSFATTFRPPRRHLALGHLGGPESS